MSVLPSAPLVYFQIKNLAEAEADFLATGKNPTFKYSEHYNAQTIAEAQAKYRSPRLDLVASSFKLQSDAQELPTFQKLTRDIYGIPSEALLPLISDYFENGTPIAAKGVFQAYREYFLRYFGEHHFSNITEAMNYYFDRSGLEKSGWTLKQDPTASSPRVIFPAKTIVYNNTSSSPSGNYHATPLHEIFGHALHHFDDITLSEGYALFLEQLSSDHFVIKRSLRYLAIAAALGIVDGQPKDFKETYDFLLDFMKTYLKDSDNLSHRAFVETARIFRGGRPDLRGAVFTKDVIYFEGNFKVWRILSENFKTYDKFVKMLEGGEL